MKPNPNYFSNYPLDRAALKRRDAAWLEAALASDAARLVLFRNLEPFLTVEAGAQEVAWLGAHARAAFASDAPPVFLGMDADGAAYFAAELPDALEDRDFPLSDMGEFVDLRAAAGGTLPLGDLAVLGAAKWLFDWHRRHGFCSVCGARSVMLDAGWKRQCPQCRAEHFPRVDPVVIMAPTLGDRVCLGRQARWPKKMYSALAGFIEPGECIEDAVAREVLEEAGLKVTHVRYHSTQPWPFPSSLMIGAICTVEDENTFVDGEELEEARWFTREEARQMLARQHPDAFAPQPLAIAHQIVKAWVEEGQ
ncbi:MAG: NAD(+) diphosphatase [Hyphomonadaceae bacterium]